MEITERPKSNPLIDAIIEQSLIQHGQTILTMREPTIFFVNHFIGGDVVKKADEK